MENKIVDQKKQDSQSETPFIQTWKTQDEQRGTAQEYLGCGCSLTLIKK